MSNQSNIPRPLLHRLGVAGPARLRAFKGTGASLTRSGRRGALLIVVTALCALAFTAAPALAKVSGEHILGATIGSGPCEVTPLEPCEGKFKEPAGIAVNESTGEPQSGAVYVVDRGNNRVEYFNAAGKFEGEFNGVHISATGSGMLTEGSTTIEGVSTETGTFEIGEEISAPGLPAGTTITKVEGDVLTVSEAATATELASSLVAHQSLSAPGAIAIDNDPSSPSHGDVYVLTTGNDSGVVDKLSPSGAYLSQITEGKPGEALERFDNNEPFFSLLLVGVAVGNNGEVFVDYFRHLPVGAGQGAFIAHYSNKEPNAWTETTSGGAGCGSAEGDCISNPVGGDLAFDPKGGFYAIAGIESGNYDGTVAKEDEHGGVVGSTPKERYANERFGKEEDVSGAAVEQSSDDVYFDDGTKVDRLSEDGSLIESFGSGELQGGSGIAVGSQGEVYVADAAADVVDIFSENTAPKAPVITEEQVTGVEVSAATLRAAIDPSKSPTSYHFEYDTTPYESSAPHGTSTPEVSIGSGEAAVPVSATLAGLAPGTRYYYRVVAASEVKHGTVEDFDASQKTFMTNPAPTVVPENCPNVEFRAEQPYGLTLPDCRAYEMVSPLVKNGSDAVVADYDAARSSLSGEAVTYESPGVFADAEGSQLIDQYIARRGPDGWSNQGITPPFVGLNISLSNAYPAMAFTPELSEGIALTDTPLTDEAAPDYKNLYLADFASTPVSYQLVTTKPAVIDGENGQPEVQGVSADLSHVVYRNTAGVGAGGVADEWVDGSLFALAGAGGGDSQPGGLANDSWRSVSADGSLVFFTVNPLKNSNEEQQTDRQVDVEENPTSSTEDCAVAGDECTLEVSKSQRAEEDPLGPGSARFRGASVNGSRVFFTDCSKLTEDATAVANKPATTCYPESGTGNDLYEYDLETGVLTDLTVDTLPADPLGAKVLGVPYISESGEYVYFVAEGTLTSGANAEGKAPVSGEPNLYVAHLEGGSWTTRFIATLAPSTKGGGDIAQEGGDSEVWNQISPLDTVRATPDGTHLAFLSGRSLTGYDNEQAQAGECEYDDAPNYSGNEVGSCREVFSYDAIAQKLVCASCNPSEARPTGPSSLEVVGAKQEFPTERIGYTPRNFSKNGARLFFDSDDALVKQDTDGKQDVYEWERSGEGSCQQAEGCVFAISDVTGNAESFFLDADPQGENVFFATADQLVPSADGDSHVNVYDARVGGGFPIAAPPPECDNADSCKPPASPQPAIFGAPSSATFSGPGNPAGGASSSSRPVVVKSTKKTVKCKKGFVKNKQGKCVKSKKGKKKAKKSTHRKGSK